MNLSYYDFVCRMKYLHNIIYLYVWCLLQRELGHTRYHGVLTNLCSYLSFRHQRKAELSNPADLLGKVLMQFPLSKLTHGDQTKKIPFANSNDGATGRLYFVFTKI